MHIYFLLSSRTRTSFSFQIEPEKTLPSFRGLFPALCFTLLLFVLTSQSTALAASSDLRKQFEEGVALFQQGKDDEAEARFLEILRKDPTLVLPHQYLGMVYARSNRFEEAKTAFQSVIQKAPTFPGGYFGLGLVLKNQGEIKQAEDFFRNTITLAPAHVSAWLHLGQILERQRKIDEAVEAYQKVMEHGSPGSPEAHEAGQRLRELGDTPEIARQVQAFVTEAETRLKEGKTGEAWTLYQKAAALLPNSLSIRLFMGSLASQLGNPAKAEEVYKEAIQIDPTAPQPHFSLAKLYEQIGKTGEAIEEYETLLLFNHDETIPEVRSAKESLFTLLDRKEIQELTRKGETLTQEGKWGEALQHFQAAAAIDPGMPVVHHNLARFYDQTNRPDLVVQSINEALLLEPESRALHLLLGKALRAQRAFKDSLAAYIKTLSLSPKENQGLFHLEAQAGLLQTEFEMLKAPIEASQPFREGLQKKANGEMDEAQALLEQAARLSPESPLIHHALGEVYEKKGEREKGIAAFEKGVELHPGLYPAWRVLSRLYAQQGRYAKALDALERLLSLSDSGLTSLGTSREEIQEERRAAQQKMEEARAKTRALFNQAQEALAKGENENAISLLEAAYNEEKDNLSILYSLGIAYAIEGKWPEATDAFSKILNSDPLHPGALLRLGAVQEARGMLPAAAQSYRRLLRQKERSDAPEYKEAAARLAAANESLKRLREAERHEKRGIAVLNRLSEIASQSGGVQPADGRPDPARLQLALWDLKQAIALRPQEARYHYNLGLLYEHLNFGAGGLNRENAERVKKEPRLLEEPVAAYRAAIEIDRNYLPPYARLGYLYEWQEENDKALTFYKSLLKVAPDPHPAEVKEIEENVLRLERRFFGNVGYLAGLDSNFNLSPQPRDNIFREPPQDDIFNGLSATLTYYLVRDPRFQIPLSYQHDTTFYYRVQDYSSSHGLSLGFQHRLTSSLSYGLTGRYQASLAKNGGLALLLSQGSASMSRFGTFPTITTLEYGYSDSYFRRSSEADAQEHRGVLSFTQAFGWQDESDISYTFTDRQTPRSPHFSYQGHRLQLGYRRWLRPDLQFRGSAAVFLQNFLNPFVPPELLTSFINRGFLPPDFENRTRRNRLLTYSLGLLYSWSETTSLFVDYQWTQNRSNIELEVLDELAAGGFLTEEFVAENNTILNALGLNPAAGNYEKRLITVGVRFAF
jgi:tetratricopeptide (TPR) repeat protein